MVFLSALMAWIFHLVFAFQHPSWQIPCTPVQFFSKENCFCPGSRREKLPPTQLNICQKTAPFNNHFLFIFWQQAEKPENNGQRDKKNLICTLHQNGFDLQKLVKR